MYGASPAVVDAVVAQTALNEEVVGDVETSATRNHGAIARFFALHAVKNPVRVLREVVVGVAIPLLFAVLLNIVVNLEGVLVVIPVAVGRECIKTGKRVLILTTAWTVVTLLGDVVSRTRKSQTVVEQLVGLLEHDVVTLEVVGRHDAFGSGVGIRHVRLNLVGTAAHSNRVDEGCTSAEEVARCVNAFRNLFAPAVGVEAAVGKHRSAVAALDFRLVESRFNGDVAGEVNANATRRTLLGGNEHNAVGCLRTVKSGCRSTLEHVDACDVVRVEV